MNEKKKSPAELEVDADTDWFNKLVAYVWSHFDSNIDVNN